MTDTTNDIGPHDDIETERDAIRDTLPDDVYILLYHGNEPHVALVQREKSPSTEYPSRGERIVLVEWDGGDSYALSTAVGRSVGWETDEELVVITVTRDEAIDKATELLHYE